MSVSYQLAGNSAGAVRAFEGVNTAIGKTEKSAAAAARETANLEKAATRIKEAIDPQTKLNRLYLELGQHVKAGRLSIDEATAAGVKYRKELLGAGDAIKATGDAGRQAFGGMDVSLTGLIAKAAQFVGPLALMRQGFQDISAAVDRANQQTDQSRISVGNLKQLAGSQAEFDALKARAEALYASGAVGSLDAGAQAVFGLSSAGLLDDQSYALFARLAQKGVISDIGGFAKSTRSYLSAFGAAEAGTGQQVLAKAFAASKYSPATVEELLQAQAVPGATAAAQGITDEELLAATSVMSASIGAQRSATAVNAFLAVTARDKKLAGLDLTERVEALRGMNLTQAKLQQRLGGIEGASAFNLISANLDTIQAAERDIMAANTDPRALRTRLVIRDAESDAELARMREFAENDLANRAEAGMEDLRARAFEDRRQRLREKAMEMPGGRLWYAPDLGINHLSEYLSGLFFSPETYLDNNAGTLGGGDASPEAQAILGELRASRAASERTAQAVETINGRNGGKVATRAE